MVVKYSIQLSEDQIRFLSSMMNDMLRIKRCNLGFRINDWNLIQNNWSRFKIKRIARSLYGIVGLVQGRGVYDNTRGYISHYFVSPELYSCIQDALENRGVFEKEIEEIDIKILRAIYERDQQLKTKYRKEWSPRFHEKEVAELSQRDENSVIDSLDRLVGLLAVTYIRDDFRTSEEIFSFTVYFLKKRWFLPPIRIPDIEKILRVCQGD